MEQKRTLWILIATGVFLCVVIGAAFLIFGNSKKTDTSAMSLKDSGMIWVSPENEMQGKGALYDFTGGPSVAASPVDGSVNGEQVNSPLSSPYAFTENSDSTGSGSGLVSEGENPAPYVGATGSSLAAGNASPAESSPADNKMAAVQQTDSLTVIAQGTTNVYQLQPTAESKSDTTTIDLNGLKNYKSSTVTAQNQIAKDAMEAAENNRRESVAKESAPKYLSSATSSEPAKPAKKSSKAAASKAPAKAAKKTAAKSTEKVPDRFWVQVGSFSNKKNADEARRVLEAKSIKCEVFTYEDKGSLKYRLRAGNYSSKTEAEYWKKQIDAIEYFAKNGSGTFIINSSAALAKK